MIFAEHVKNKLSSLIHEMATAPWLFSKNPEVDFSRNRKLDFVSTIQFLLMESGSLKKELLDYFQFSVDTPSASAFCQQRNKLLLEAFQFLFYEFNSCFSFEKKYKDYQLLACDGSDLNIARNPNDAGTYFQSQPTDRGFHQIHLNALFDLCEKRYIDLVIQPARLENESLAMTQMIDRYKGEKKTIFIADRGYETYNIFAHVQEKGMCYLIRVKDGGGELLTGSFDLPDENEFDHDMQLILTRKQTKHVYQMNYTIAIHICRYFLRNDISPPDVETLIQKNLLPVRPGRSDPRKVKPKSAVSFLYRVA